MNKSLIKYIASLLIFGSNGVVASMIHASSCEIVMFRTLIGSILLIGLYLIKHKRFTFHHHKKAFTYLCLSGCALGISWLFLYEAYNLIGVSLASLGYYCGPIIVIALSPLLFREKLTAKKIVCFFIVLGGIVLVTGITQSISYNPFGIFCALMAALLYAVMVSFNKKAEGIPSMENSAIQITIAFICVFIFVMIKQGMHFNITKTDIVPLLFLGIVNTGIGCFLYFSSFSDIRVQTIAILGYLEPLSAVIFSFFFLKEVLGPVQILGAILIIGGAILAELNLPAVRVRS